MQCSNRGKNCWGLLMLVFASCSSNAIITDLQGTITVDGIPVEVGTIHFRQIDEVQSRGVGGVLTQGRFVLSDSLGIPVGRYLATLQASKSTGRTIKDQQKGDVAEMTAIQLAAPTQEVEITSANARNFKLDFSTNSS